MAPCYVEYKKGKQNLTDPSIHREIDVMETGYSLLSHGGYTSKTEKKLCVCAKGKRIKRLKREKKSETNSATAPIFFALQISNSAGRLTRSRDDKHLEDMCRSKPFHAVENRIS